AAKGDTRDQVAEIVGMSGRARRGQGDGHPLQGPRAQPVGEVARTRYFLSSPASGTATCPGLTAGAGPAAAPALPGGRAEPESAPGPPAGGGRGRAGGGRTRPTAPPPPPPPPPASPARPPRRATTHARPAHSTTAAPPTSLASHPQARPMCSLAHTAPSA